MGDRETAHFLSDRRRDLARVRRYLSPHVVRRLQVALVHAEGMTGGSSFEDTARVVFRAMRDSEAPFPFPEILYRKLLQQYEVQPSQESSFVEFLFLAALESIASLAASPKDPLFQEEITIVHELSRQFTAEEHDHALPAHMISASFPVPLPEHILILARELKLDPKDVSERFVRGSGHGGQKINKTSSCVELTHEPTRIAVRVQQFREQHKNRIAAWKLLIEKREEQIKGAASRRAGEQFKIRKQKARRSRKSKEKMLQAKKQRGEIKKLRRELQ